MDNIFRKEASIDAIKIAITALNQQGKKVTQKNVAELTKGSVSISTIRRHWKDVTQKISPVITDIKKISSMPVESTQKISSMPVSNDFNRFKRRAKSTPTTFTPFSIDKL